MSPQIKPIQLIKANRLFEHISDSEFNLTVNKQSLLSVKEGDIIFRMGDSADQIFLILEGEIKVKQTIENDVPRIFLKNKNDFLGEKEFLENKSRSSSAVADKDCMLYVLNRKEINDLVSRNRKIWSNLNGESPIVDFSEDTNYNRADSTYEDFKKTRDEIREIMGLSGFEDPTQNPEDLLSIDSDSAKLDDTEPTPIDESENKKRNDTLNFLKHTTLKFSETEGINGKSKSSIEKTKDEFELVTPHLSVPQEEPEVSPSSFEQAEEIIAGEFNIEEPTSKPADETEVPKLNLNFIDEAFKESSEETKFDFGSIGRDTSERSAESSTDELKTTTEKFSWDFTPSSEQDENQSESENAEHKSEVVSVPSAELNEEVFSTEEKIEQEELEEKFSWDFSPSSEESDEKISFEDKVKLPVNFDDALPNTDQFSWNFKQTQSEETQLDITQKEKPEILEENFSWDFSSSEETEIAEEKKEQPETNFKFDEKTVQPEETFKFDDFTSHQSETEGIEEDEEPDDEILSEKETEKVKLNLDAFEKEEEFSGSGFAGLNIPDEAGESKFQFDTETPFFKEKNFLEKKKTYDTIEREKAGEVQNQRTLTADQLNLLISCTHSVNSNFKIDEVLRSIIDAATTLARADRGTLYIVDNEKNEIWSKIVRGDNIEEIRLKVGVGLAGWVAQTGETINIEDAATDNRFNPEYDKISGYKTKSMICFPIKNKVGMVVGVLQLINSLRGQFTEIDEDFLEALSVHAALALEKAELFEQTLKTDRLSSLGKVANFIIGDIKKPILTIKHFTEHIKKKSITPDVRQVLDMIIQQTNGVINLIQTTLSYSEGKTILRSKVQSLNKVIDEILEQLAEYVELRNVKLFRKYDKDVFVNVDRRELYQAVYQITKNACDALPNGGKFFISTKASETEVEIILKDEGLGIPPSILERIFEPFMSHGKKNGVGLGLCIAEKIVKEHEGRIIVESELGEGTEVKILLPLKK